MNSRLPLRLCLLPISISALALLLSGAPAGGAEPLPVAHYYDEESMRFLTLRNTSATGVEVLMRFASEPGSTATWLGQGIRKDNVVSFAAVVEEGQDRGTYFIAKGGESKMEVLFKPGQKMPQDAGLLGIYRRVSDEKRLQLAKREFQTGEDRLNAALKEAAHNWPGADKPVPADWKSRWPAMVSRWMKIAYQPPEAPKVKQPFPAAKDTPNPEKDVQYWLKLAQVTSMGCSFAQQMPSLKGGDWDGEYDDNLGGHVSIRRMKDGRLNVTLSCTRVNENQGGDLSGRIPPDSVKKKDGESTASAVFNEGDVPEDAKEVNVTLKRKGGFLWVDIKRKATPPGSLSWYDGIYRWSEPPKE
ncbi:hypothetical protein [Prosthecobacter sp.]|uniref:hypothetical protein n=1 Tax=Prosthecobacter sp. TaxID=1965333 RepID=UPI00378322D4